MPGSDRGMLVYSNSIKAVFLSPVNRLVVFYNDKGKKLVSAILGRHHMTKITYDNPT